MLLINQAGSVKIGEVVRYTVTYTPSNDRILPTPSHLHVKIKNTSPIPLRAAWVHGPYALHVAAYPSTFNPHHKVEDPKRDGTPDYEPMLKAGGSWHTKLTIPEVIREKATDVGKRRHSNQSAESFLNKDAPSVTWIIEIASQILFSNSASVAFELLVGRDERSLELGFAAVAGHGHGTPGQIQDIYKTDKERKSARKQGNVQTSGVYSKAVKLVVEDTEQLWNKPALPTWDDKKQAEPSKDDHSEEKMSSKQKPENPKKKKRVHLVVITHGLHSNLGADMLFMKESIDATVRQARVEAMDRKREERRKRQQTKRPQPETKPDSEETATAPLTGGQEELENAVEEDDDEEETIVRGFNGNAAKTENGIQFLGKRLAKYIMRFTYPDQPFLPVKKSFSRKMTDTFKSEADKAKRDGEPSHSHSSIHEPPPPDKDALPYTFTSISFIGHSLGGLVQTYAVAYIHKHSPEFFHQIKPINFICLASPMLGLSNENPMYIKFALDFGLVGRTGQDLGLTWRPPTLARTGWNAVVNGLTGSAKPKEDQNKQEDPAAKPLLRILPTGPAHQILRLFRNRTLYSNVVNDGIVPLRTSCLLFLDWRGLGKVEKARRENGLIGTMAEWGWAELTGANMTNLPPNVIAERYGNDGDADADGRTTPQGRGDAVPQPAEDETTMDNKVTTNRVSYEDDDSSKPSSIPTSAPETPSVHSPEQKGMLDGFFGLFRAKTPDQPRRSSATKKAAKAIRRAQTLHPNDTSAEESDDTTDKDHGTTSNPTMRPHMLHRHTGASVTKSRPKATRGDSMLGQNGEVTAPPKTSIFESAGDILHPPLPSKQWITDPTTRARTIFHDRVYHPEDIPPPPVKRSKSSSRTLGQGAEAPSASQESVESSGMKVEEKIARAYHRDLSWRKVLVRLEPDAHNNMIVRRMFANAYGWPVVKHLCDTHFADTYAARTRDEKEPARERAPPLREPVPEDGEQVKDQTSKKEPVRTTSETREARDELADLHVSRDGITDTYSSQGRGFSRENSVVWDDSIFEGSEADDSDIDERNIVARMLNPNASAKKPATSHAQASSSGTTAPSTPQSLSFSITDGHRGLTPKSPTSPRSPLSMRTAVTHQPISPVFDASTMDAPIVTSALVEEPDPVSPTVPGLRKSITEQLNPSLGKRDRPRSSQAGEEEKKRANTQQ